MNDTERNEAEQPRDDAGDTTGEHFDLDSLKNILEGLLLAAARPLSLDQLQTLLGGEEGPDKGTLRRALQTLEEDCAHRGVELVEVASGFRLQVRQELQPWVTKLWEERPPRYSRALLETLALIAYRQPITRGEIEDVRGVSVSTNIIRQLEEREWIRVVGHRDVPGKPSLFGTTKAFLDYFNLKSLDDLPSLAELRDIESLEPELDFSGGSQGQQGDQPEASGEAASDEAEALALQAESAEAGEADGDPEASQDQDGVSPDGEPEAGEPGDEEAPAAAVETAAADGPETDAEPSETADEPEAVEAGPSATDDPSTQAPEETGPAGTLKDDDVIAGEDDAEDESASGEATQEWEDASERDAGDDEERRNNEAASAGRR
jgi:segregation and condensation protein B